MFTFKTNKAKVIKILMLCLVIALIIVWLFPLWNIFASATKSMKGYTSTLPWQLSFDTNPFQTFLQNIKTGLLGTQKGSGIAPAFTNSIIYGLISVIVAVFSASLAAFALACLPIKGRFIFFVLIFSGTIFPLQIYLIPLFSFFQKTGLYDTKVGLCLVYIAICIPFSVFLLRNWYLDVPIEIFEAAKIDGANEFQTYRRIFFPLSGPPFVTLFLFQFTWVWNDFIFGITFARSATTRPIMALLAGLQNMYSNVGIPAVLASAILVSVPTILLLIIFKKKFFKGLAMQYGGSSK